MVFRMIVNMKINDFFGMVIERIYELLYNLLCEQSIL